MRMLGRSLLLAGITSVLLAAPAAASQTAPTADENIARWSAELETSLGTAMARFASSDPRRLAQRRSVRVTLALPWPPVMLDMWSGPLRIEWTATSRAIRKLGLRPRRGKPVRLARGVSNGMLLPAAHVDLELTRTGRRAFNRAERLRVDVAASLQIDGNTAGIAARHALALTQRR